MIALNLHIGTEILLRQKQNGWGSKVVARLSADLQAIFPGLKEFGTSNLKYMKSFAEKCQDGQIGQQAADQLPDRFGAQLPTTHQIESEMSAKPSKLTKYPVAR